MKIKLESVRDISVLNVTGPVTLESFAVIKAGIKKLFSSGKNKIVLELPDSGAFPTPVLREIAILNLLASELSGQIVLAHIAPLTRAKIEAFSKPPVVTCFPDRNAAAEFFDSKSTESPASKAPAPVAVTPIPSPVAPTPAPTPAPAVVAAPKPVAPAAPAPAPTEEEQKNYKKEIRTQELGDIGQVRKQLSELEIENKELKTRLAELMIARRDPPDVDSWREKTTKLEKELAEAIRVAQDMAAAQQKK